MAWLAAAAPWIMAGAAVVSAGATVMAGNEAKKQGEASAREKIAMGKERFAAAQREALEAKLAGKLAQSRQIAASAASGAGGADTPSIAKLMTETGERSRYAVEVAMYKGYSEREFYNASARNDRAEGRASLLGGVLRAAGTLAGGLAQAGGMFD